jgi:hypothetical protein
LRVIAFLWVFNALQRRYISRVAWSADHADKWVQSALVEQLHWPAVHVSVGIQSTLEADWVAFPISSGTWVVVPEIVVVKVCFLVEILAR